MHSDLLEARKWGKCISIIQDGGVHFFLYWGGGGLLRVVKEYEIITLKYIGKACRCMLILIKCLIN